MNRASLTAPSYFGLAAALCLLCLGCGDVYVDKYREQPGRVRQVEGEPNISGTDYQEFFSPFKGESLQILTRHDDFLSPTIVERIETEYGIGVELVVCHSHAEFIEREADDEPYDLVFLSDHLLSELYEDGKLGPLNWKQIPNLKKLARGGLVEQLSVLFAETNLEYIAPYTWSCLGLAINVDALGGALYPWQLIFDPNSASPPRGRLLKDRVSARADARVMVGTALISLGHSPNTTDTDQIKQAAEELAKQVEFIDQYLSTSLNQAMVTEDYLLSMEWSDAANVLQRKNPRVSFIVPDEGSIVVLEAFAVLRKSDNPDLGQAMINYFLEPSVAGVNASDTNIASALRTARPYTNRDLITGAAYAFPAPPENAKRLVTLPEEAMAEYLSVWEQTQNALARRKEIDDTELQFLSSLALACTLPESTRLRSPFEICFTVVNDGKTVSKDTELSVELPTNLEFLSADNGGVLEKGRIKWQLDSIIAGHSSQVCAQIRGTEIRPATVRAQVKNMILTTGVSTSGTTTVIGVPAVTVDVVDNDPVAVGDQIIYEILLLNPGNGPDNDAVLEVWLDENQTLVDVQGPTERRDQEEGQHLVFNAIDSVPAGGEFRFQITVQAKSEGVAHLKVQVKTAYRTDPITAEESTTQFN